MARTVTQHWSSTAKLTASPNVRDVITLVSGVESGGTVTYHGDYVQGEHEKARVVSVAGRMQAYVAPDSFGADVTATLGPSLYFMLALGEKGLDASLAAIKDRLLHPTVVQSGALSHMYPRRPVHQQRFGFNGGLWLPTNQELSPDVAIYAFAIAINTDSEFLVHFDVQAMIEEW